MGWLTAGRPKSGPLLGSNTSYPCLHTPRSGLKVNFLVFAFCDNNLFAWRANQWPFLKEDRYYSFFTPQLLSLGLGPLKGLTRVSSSALNLTSALLPKLQKNRDTLRCAVPDTVVPSHYQEQQVQTLIVCLYKTHFNTIILDCKKPTE